MVTPPQASNLPFTPKYSLSHLTLLDCSIPELVFIAHRAGYDCIGPRLIQMGVEGECAFVPLEKEIVRATKNALRMTGMEVIDIELARITDDCDVKSLEPAMEAGMWFGARHMTVSAWNTQGGVDYIMETYAEICDSAKGYGLSVPFEFPSFSSVRTLSEAAQIVAGVQRDNAGILIDTLYMHMSKVDLEELGELPREWFKIIQVCDSPAEIPDDDEERKKIARGERIYPGEGVIDFHAILEKLPPVHYSIELPNRILSKELGYEQHARRCLQSAKKVFQAFHGVS